MNSLLGTANAKTMKGEKQGYYTAVLYMAPADIALSGRTLCPWSTPGCRAACLYTAGRGRFNNVQAARVRKARLFLTDRAAFMAQLDTDIARHVRAAARRGLTPAVRLNGTTDIAWMNIWDKDGRNVFERFPDVQFYDYTKRPPATWPEFPPNYDVTYSRSEQSTRTDIRMGARRSRTAVVFKGTLPATYLGIPVVDGDSTDLRFLDPIRVIVGLKAKGDAKKDTTGFVITEDN